VGTIAAGLPLYAQQEWNGSLVLDPVLFKGEALFALKVKGDSMKDAGILSGDLVICEPRQYAQNGEIVAVLIHHEEATVKRFFLKPEGIELRPENPEFKAVTYGFGEVLVQGKVIGLVRGPESFR
jgi:repressor LexA